MSKPGTSEDNPIRCADGSGAGVFVEDNWLFTTFQDKCNPPVELTDTTRAQLATALGAIPREKLPAHGMAVLKHMCSSDDCVFEDPSDLAAVRDLLALLTGTR